MFAASDFQQVLIIVALLAVWVVLARWVLPKLGVPT